MAQATQTLRKQWIEIRVDGSPSMDAYLVKPQESPEGPWPAVIVLMEIFGVNSHIREVTERIAAEGYVAIAPNYFHRSTRNLELGYSEPDVATGRQHKEKTTREGIISDIRATVALLQENLDVSPKSKIGCVGFCFGGHAAYIAAGFDEIAATACFYPGGVASLSPGGGAPTVTHTREIKGEVLCLFGEEDPIIPHQDTVTIDNALKEAGVKHEVVRYSNVGHGFFCNQREDYDAAAAEDAWRRVKALFDRNLR
ncbi:MAG TPA: dienelactone hydrolase family protein [Coleofasciculaceae cyanobacterium]|jgi:carboxymethylenebutenolidase